MIASVAAIPATSVIGFPVDQWGVPGNRKAASRADVKATSAAADTNAPRTDEALAVAASRGDGAAFGELVKRYQTAVYNLAFRMLGRAEDAEDAAQESFLRAFSKLASYKPDSRFGTWLLSITAHRCIDQLRRKQNLYLEEMPGMDWPGRSDEEPEAASLDHETRDEVQSLLGVLPPMYRAPLVLRYWYDHSYDEIAKVLQVTEATVKTRLFRARQMLAQAHLRQRGAVAVPA